MILLTAPLRIVLAVGTAFVTVFILRSQIKTGLRPGQYFVIGLVVATAMVHMLSGANNNLLFLNGAGYMVLLTGLYFLPLGPLSGYRPVVYLALIGYTIATIGLYFVIHPWGMHGGEPDRLGWLTKIIEVGLVALLVFDLVQMKTTLTHSPNLGNGD